MIPRRTGAREIYEYRGLGRVMDDTGWDGSLGDIRV